MATSLPRRLRIRVLLVGAKAVRERVARGVPARSGEGPARFVEETANPRPRVSRTERAAGEAAQEAAAASLVDHGLVAAADTAPGSASISRATRSAAAITRSVFSPRIFRISASA